MKEQLLKTRKALGLTQAEVSKLTGISIVTINRAEGKGVKLKTYERIFDVLGKLPAKEV